MNWNKYRYVRKEHSIEKVHDIWVKAKERSTIRRNRFNNFINTIPNHVEPNDKGDYILYYNIKETVNVVVLNFRGRFGGWSFHTDHLNMDKDRDKILSYWIADDSITELGNKFREMDKDRGYRLEGISRKILDDKINRHFREHFNKLKKYPPDSFITIIGDKKYIVTTKDRHDYATFTLSSEVEEPIKINESISKS